MKKLLFLVLTILSAQMLSAQSKITLTAGGESLTAVLADTQAAQELLALLASGPVAIQMEDYGGFEKVGALPQPLTPSDTRITTSPGDIMLYQGRNIVVFYGANTWSYTPLGKIEGASAASLRGFLGSGSIELTLSLPASTAVAMPSATSPLAPNVCDINGRTVTQRPLPPGIYIVNGRKTLIP